MKYESTQIMSRIEWCRLQQQLHSITWDERAGWRAEEDGLADALDGRDRIALMREDHPSQFSRYRRGLLDGQALLSLGTLTPCGMTGMEGWSPLLAPALVNSRPPSQVPPSAHMGSVR
ncbi:MAG: hypothetical protein Q8L74_04900 [Nitrospirota bacterium]|nr:hypothetical protein [Nitrospirota bacterium]